MPALTRPAADTGPPPSLTARPDDPDFHRAVALVALRRDVPRRELRTRALLELPRITDAAARVGWDEALELLDRVAADTPVTARWSPHDGQPDADVQMLELRPADEGTARTICEEFHYIRSHRPDGGYFGLFGPGSDLPATLFVVTPVDGGLVDLVAASPVAAERVLVLARVFSFHDAPRNAISYGLARLGRALATETASSLVTYVNPNVGFSGSSYAASGWTHVGDEPLPWYSYLDGRYVTERELRREHGPAYAAVLEDRLARSRQQLQPLAVFGDRLPQGGTQS